ncbi:MAG: Crp/Fnr family transcriptional regulator [Kiloniellales bacterium]|nr:Crp/Fnr family transcriptional regulator [Kiloniellales bacterium]
MSSGWISQFADLAALPAEDQRLLTERAVNISLPAGTTVFAPGKAADNFLLVLDGTIRVHQVSASGREIVLYRVSGGETCIMTTACLLADEAYAAEGMTETSVEAVAIPRTAFEDAIARSPGFRRLVFSDYSHRISDLMHIVEEVAFERMDKRLAQRLVTLATAEGRVVATHQELAAELGTAREVVGRQLKELERRGWVAVSRGQIALTDRVALSSLAES